MVPRLKKRAMRIGIIGPAQSGKTTIFKILLQSADIAGDIGMFKFMDQRIEKLSNIYSSKKKVYPETSFLDIRLEAGFTGKEYSKLHDIDLFICVANAFFSVDPKKDLEGYITDIILSDLEAIQNRCAKIEKDRLKMKTDVESELKLLKKCQGALENSRLLRNMGLTRDELKVFSGFSFISLRPIIVAINLEEGKQSYHLTKQLLLPPVIIHPEDVLAFLMPQAEPNFITMKKITGNKVFATNEKVDLRGNVLLIPSADPGYDWIFSHNIGGFVTMYGGANSHMAIRAAEQGLPAVIGVGEVLYDRLAKSKTLEIDCAKKQIKVLK